MAPLTARNLATSIIAVTLIAVVLLLVAVFILPPALSAALPELEDPSHVRTPVIWGILLIYAVWVGVLLVLRLLRSPLGTRWLGADSHLRGEHDAALERLKICYTAAIRALSHGRSSSARPLPWVMLIGDRGAGRSAALLSCGQSIGMLDVHASGYTPAHGQDCAWVRCGDNVVLDTNGSLCSDPARRPVWLGLLELLRPRPGAPSLDAVVIVVNLALMLQDGKDEARRRLTTDLRRQLDDIVTTTGTTPPVHVLFTHLDEVEGFGDYFDSGAQFLTDGCGRWFPREAQAQQSIREVFGVAWEDLVRAIEAVRPQSLAGRTPGSIRRALAFPGQLRGGRETLSALMHGLSQRAGPGSRLPVVSFWLSSACAGAGATSVITQRLDEALGLRAQRVAEDTVHRAQGRAMFLRYPFERVFSIRSQAERMASEERQRRALASHRTARMAGAVVILGGGFVLLLGVQNLRMLQLMRSQGDRLTLALTSSEGPLDPAGLESVVVLCDLVTPAWSGADDPETQDMLLWAYDLADATRPGWFRRSAQAAARWGARPGVEALCHRYAQEKLTNPARAMLQAEVQNLASQDTSTLEQRREGQPLPEELRRWATNAWLASDLAERWQDLSLTDRKDSRDDIAEQRTEVAAGIVSLIVRLRGTKGEIVDAPGPVSLAERALVLGCLKAQEAGTKLPPLPSPEEIERLQRKLAPVDAADLLYSVSIGGTEPSGPLLTRSSVLRATRGGTLSDGAPGFTAKACAQFEQAVLVHEQEGTFARFKSGTTSADDRLAMVRADYLQGHDEAWTAWLEQTRISTERLSESPGQLEATISDVFRPGGDLDRWIAAAGQAPGSAADETTGESSWCQCRRESRWLAQALGPDGPLRADLEGLQGAMDAMGQELKVLAQDRDARRDAVQDGLGGRGPVLDAVTAAEALSRVMRGYSPPIGACGDPRSASLRALNDLWADRIDELAYGLINAAWRWLISEFERDAERAWRDEVLSEWQSLRTKYPFAVNSMDDASQDEIAAMLGPGGTADVFVQLWVTPLTNGKMMRRPNWKGAPSLELTSSALTIAERLRDAQRAVQSLSGTWDVTLSCSDLKWEANSADWVTSRTVALENVIELRCEDPTKKQATVQVQASTALHFLAARKTDHTGDCLDFSGPGTWPLFRMLDHLNNFSDPKMLHFEGGCDFHWGYKESRTGPAATLKALRGVGLPERLFQPIGLP